MQKILFLPHCVLYDLSKIEEEVFCRSKRSIILYFRCQFHQRLEHAYFVRTSFWQFFSSYMYVVKAAKTMFVRKICMFNVDEIDFRCLNRFLRGHTFLFV